MDLQMTKDDESFREEALTWLTENVPTDRPPADLDELRRFDTAWQRRQFTGGWAGIDWPTDHGGRGLSIWHQLIWYEACSIAGAPDVGSRFVGLNHAGPTLIARANPDQQKLYLPAILRGDSIWCQGFSEPEAGSDLASLRTTGVIDADTMIVNGQKIWTSYAPIADYQELLVRTDASSSRHHGLTWIICDMHLGGIDIRPIPSVTGDTHFAEIFYDNVSIPIHNVVGEVGDGWSVARSTFAFERGTASISRQVELANTLEEITDYSRRVAGPDGRRPALADDHIGDELALLRAEVAALRAMTYRVASRSARYGAPGPEGSMIRLYYSELVQRIMAIAYEIDKGRTANDGGANSRSWDHEYLHSLRTTIAGGTKDIQRNIVGERVLGLARGR